MGMGKMNNLSIYFISLLIKVVSRNKLLILNYHQVISEQALFLAGDLSIEEFSWHIRLVKKYLNPLPLALAIDLMHKQKLPKGSVVVTFDDGYKDNIENALPVLIENSVPATFFIATAFLNGGIMWNDVIIHSIKQTNKEQIDLTSLNLKMFLVRTKEEKVKTIEELIGYLKYKKMSERQTISLKINEICEVRLPLDLMMNKQDVIKLYQAGMEIGGHTSNHPILSSEDDDTVVEEIKSGKRFLEKLLKTNISSFAYPNGKYPVDYNVKHRDIVKNAGFNMAVTTNWGLNNSKTDEFQLYRFTPWDKKPVKFLLRLLKLYCFNKV